MLYKYEINTDNQGMYNITGMLHTSLSNSKIENGIAVIYTKHTTAAITINENADEDVKTDLLFTLNKVFPDIKEYRHFEGNSDAHIKSSLFGVSKTVIIDDNEPVLGIWQGIYFCEFDGPRTRTVYIKIMEG